MQSEKRIVFRTDIEDKLCKAVHPKLERMEWNVFRAAVGFKPDEFVGAPVIVWISMLMPSWGLLKGYHLLDLEVMTQGEMTEQLWFVVDKGSLGQRIVEVTCCAFMAAHLGVSCSQSGRDIGKPQVQLNGIESIPESQNKT